MTASPDGPPLVHGLGFVRLGVADLDRAVGFYRDACQLAVADIRGGDVYLTGGVRHHWLRLSRSTQAGAFGVGYEVSGIDAIDEARSRLRFHGVHVSEDDGGGIFERALTFCDPDGVDVQLHTQMAEQALPPHQPIVHMSELLHAAWIGRDAVRAHDFYAGTLGFRASDWIERRTVYLRSGNHHHHSLAIHGGGSPSLDHLCIMVEGIDDVARARNNALRHGGVLRHDFRHPATCGSIGVEVRDPVTGIGVEFCTPPRSIDGPRRRSRILCDVPTTADLWSELPNRSVPAAESSPALGNQLGVA